MGKRNIYKLVGYGLPFAIGLFFLVSIYKELNKFDEHFKAKEQTTIMKFKGVDQTIYITSRCWGLGGQHYHTILSPFDPATDWAAIDREKEIVLDNECGFVYK